MKASLESVLKSVTHEWLPHLSLPLLTSPTRIEQLRRQAMDFTEAEKRASLALPFRMPARVHLPAREDTTPAGPESALSWDGQAADDAQRPKPPSKGLQLGAHPLD